MDDFFGKNQDFFQKIGNFFIFKKSPDLFPRFFPNLSFPSWYRDFSDFLAIFSTEIFKSERQESLRVLNEGKEQKTIHYFPLRESESSKEEEQGFARESEHFQQEEHGNREKTLAQFSRGNFQHLLQLYQTVQYELVTQKSRNSSKEKGTKFEKNQG